MPTPSCCATAAALRPSCVALAVVASAWFDDRLLNLGRLDGGVDGLVELELSLDFVGRSFGDGFYFNAVAASTVPVPAAAWLLASALGFLGFAVRSPQPA
mgnify:CR=1 FL=1